MSLLLLGAGLFPLLLFVVSLFGRFHFVAEIITSCRLHVMLLLIPPGCFLFLTRRYWLALVYGLAIAFCAVDVLSVYIPSSQSEPGSRQITILSFNVFNQNSDPQFDAQTIEQYDADLLLVTEFTRDWSNILNFLTYKYPHHSLHPRWHGYGIGIYSKFPIETKHLESLSEIADIPMLDVHIKVDDKTLRIGGLHTVSPVSQIRMNLRDQQIEQAFEHFADSRFPTIILGDFNAVPWSHSLQPHKRHGFRDSRQGFGYHASWNQKIPLLKLPIDHAFVTRNIHVHDRQIGPSEGSDHRPIYLTISISDERSE